MIQSLLQFISLFWLVSFIGLIILYQIDRIIWSKKQNVPMSSKSKNSLLVLLIPGFVGAPIFLALLIYDLFNKGGFGKGEKKK